MRPLTCLRPALFVFVLALVLFSVGGKAVFGKLPRVGFGDADSGLGLVNVRYGGIALRQFASSARVHCVYPALGRLVRHDSLTKQGVADSCFDGRGRGGIMAAGRVEPRMIRESFPPERGNYLTQLAFLRRRFLYSFLNIYAWREWRLFVAAEVATLGWP